MLQHHNQINTGSVAAPLSPTATSKERTAATAEFAARRKFPANGQIAMLDLSVDPPTRIVLDYQNGAERFERDPVRWRPEALDDAAHAAAVEAHQRRKTL